MSSNLNICDLDPDLILMATDYLPYRDKIKLVDLFPFVRNQITVFDTLPMGDYSIEQKMSLFEKLTNVYKVTRAEYLYNTSSYLIPLRKLILDGSNKQIKHFLFEGSNGPIGDKFISRESGILSYIQNVKKIDPSYDASCIKNIFDITSKNVLELMKKYPDLKLKFGLELGSFSDENSGLVWEPILKNPSLDGRVVFMKLNGDSIRLIPNEIRRPFESVVELDLKDVGYRSGEIFMDNLKHILQFIPNVMKLMLEVQMSHLLGDDNDGVKIANEFVSSLFSITKLNQLIVEFRGLSWTPTQQHIDTFRNIMNQLLTSRQKPGLKKLCITSDFNNWDIVQTVSNVDIRNDFKYLELHNIINEQHFEIKNHGMRMVKIKPSIQYLFSRFPKIKWIDITTEDECFRSRKEHEYQLRVEQEYRSRVQQEYQNIKNFLPRNRWLQMNIKKPFITLGAFKMRMLGPVFLYESDEEDAI